MLHVTKACLSSLKYKPCDLGTMQPCNYVTSSTRYRWNDANLIPIAQRCLLVLEETDIFLIDINIYKPAHLADVIYQSLLNPRIAGLQFNDGFTDGGRLYLDDLLIVRQLSQRGRYSYVLRHKLQNSYQFSGSKISPRLPPMPQIP